MEQAIEVSIKNEDGLEEKTQSDIKELLIKIEDAINKTSKCKGEEPVQFLNGGLDEKIKEILEKSNKRWFAYGFYTGHVHAYSEWSKDNTVNNVYERKLTRRFGYDGEKTSVTIKSTAYIIDENYKK